MTASPTPARRWPSGATIITISGRIHRWGTKPPRKRAGRLSNLRALRPARLRHPKSTTIKPADSRYERGTTGGAGHGRSRKAATRSSISTQRQETCRCANPTRRWNYRSRLATMARISQAFRTHASTQPRSAVRHSQTPRLSFYDVMHLISRMA